MLQKGVVKVLGTLNKCGDFADVIICVNRPEIFPLTGT